jgi:hypothetical protein
VIKCRITIISNGRRLTFIGLYPNDDAAWDHAFEHAPSPKFGISVMRLP